MNKILVSFTFLLLFNLSFAQLPKRINWNVSSQAISATESKIIFEAKLDKDWHIWALNPGHEDMIPPSFTFEPGNFFKLKGKISEQGKLKTKAEEALDNATLRYYENKVIYTQLLTYTKPGKIKGSIEYQICDLVNCLPPDNWDFEIELKAYNPQDTVQMTSKFADTAMSATTQNTIDTSLLDSVKTTLSEEAYGIFGNPINPCDIDGNSSTANMTPLMALFLGILGGIAALLFPCTFPMIPMTMSFFLKSSQDDPSRGTKNAILYGFSIFLVYALLSLPFLFLGWSSDALNDFSTNEWVNLAFFVIFVYFAFSLLGYYDISLPSSLANKIDKKSHVGSFMGIFFMALTLAIVSFSCTGPILGLVLGNLKNVKLLTPAMSGFGIGLGVPFALFALFPKALDKLPKMGSWLEILKAVFGFIELAFAIKFLSNADLVKQWGFLKRELFIVIWILISVVTSLYLLGLIKLPKLSKVSPTKITRGLAVIFLVFAGYLGTDFFGGDLRHISGFPPPKYYSYFHHEEEIKVIKNDFEAAKAKAIAEKKPLLIDFTGHACVNCRKMEENVWIEPTIKDKLIREFIIVSLYVDEKKELPESEQYFSESLGKKIISVGNKNTEFELKNFHQVTQPLYVILDIEKNQIMTQPQGGYMSVEDFRDFLDCGLNGYHKNQKK
ncbi:MAG: thioredoxin family protein [Chitinophagales bacterium]|jgi:thiol:disulfide interchange protein DsbD|nr:thioredoxin family protein [Chitinophagales bacterium]